MADSRRSVPPVLIEQWLPIAELGVECQREGGTGKHPPVNRLHVWWARRPLAVSGAAILGSVLPQWRKDWPAKLRAQFPTEDAYRQWFKRLLGILGDPVTGRKLIQYAREKGIKLPGSPYGYPRGFTVNPDEGQIRILKDLLDHAWGSRELPVLDPMAGGGSIPFEALRFGFRTHANELNPVASVILKATLEYPARYGAALAQDVAKWGKLLGDRVASRLASYFLRQDGENIFVYIWCRTVACPYTGKPIPLSPNWWLEKLTKTVGGREVHHGTAMRPVLPANGKAARFEIVEVDGKKPFDPSVGTVRGGSGISPWAQNQAVDGDYIKAEAKAGRMGQQLCAIGLATPEGRRFRAVTSADLAAVEKAEAELAGVRPAWEAKGLLPTEHRYIGPSDRLENYGQLRFADVFGPRQLLALGTVVEEYRLLGEEIRRSHADDPGRAEAILAYLAIAVDKIVDYNSRQAVWHPSRGVIAHTFSRHDFRFKWSHAEYDVVVPRLGFEWVVSQVTDAYKEIARLVTGATSGPQAELRTAHAGAPADRLQISQGNATALSSMADGQLGVVCVDPPYYDNVIYSECADFFYIWLKRTFGFFYPALFAEELTNKDDEAVANWARFEEFGKGKKKLLARQDYERKMAACFREIHRVLRADGVLSVMFTHKEVDAWDTLATALIGAGFAIKASWPVHTESEHSLHQAKKNAAASTILLVCRKREPSPEPVWWDDLKNTVRTTARRKAEEFERQGIRGVDLYISTFGPTLSIISEHWPVLTGDVDPKMGQPKPLRPDVALDLAREEVVNLRKRGLLLGRSVQFDQVTDWYLMAWDAFRAEQFPADEARKLAIALGLNIEDDLVKTKRIVTKKADFVALQPASARRKKGMVDPDLLTFDCQIDAVHTAMLVLDEDGQRACERFLRQARLLQDGTFKACLQALINAVPRTKKKGKFVRAEAALLDKLRDIFFPDLTVPPEEAPPPLPAQQTFGFAKAAEDAEEYGEDEEEDEAEDE